MSFWRVVGAVVWKDVVTEWRTRAFLIPMMAFAGSVILMLDFASVVRLSRGSEMVLGALWVAFLLAGMLGLGRSFAPEWRRGYVDGLLLAPVSRSAIYLGKWLANWCFISLMAVMVTLLASASFSLDLIRADLLLVTVAGTAGYAGVGTCVSALTAHSRDREILLPLLLFPVTLPLLLTVVEAATSLLQGQALPVVGQWVGLLLGFDLLVLVVSCLCFDEVVGG